jgi:predicted transposase YbfD/YdcC
MSGAAGISAAKRRRGIAQSSTPSPPVANTQPVQQQRSAPFNPIKILENHELRLRKVEPRLENAFEGFEAHEKRLEEIENVLTRLIENTNSNTSDKNHMNDTWDANAEKRLSILENDLMELKSLITKVQTFAMETNISLQQLSRERVAHTVYPRSFDLVQKTIDTNGEVNFGYNNNSHENSDADEVDDNEHVNNIDNVDNVDNVDNASSDTQQTEKVELTIS